MLDDARSKVSALGGVAHQYLAARLDESTKEYLQTVQQATSMKMVIAVVQDYDCDRLLTALSERGIRATRLASMGGFLRTGNTTVLMGMSEATVPTALATLQATCQSRTISALTVAADAVTDVFPGEVADVNIGGAVVFVAPVERFEQVPRI